MYYRVKIAVGGGCFVPVPGLFETADAARAVKREAEDKGQVAQVTRIARDVCGGPIDVAVVED